jgi:uncharacterized DUF497 family protein
MALSFEWDDAKASANIEKHGVDFIDAVQIFAGRTVEAVDDRQDYGETRIRSIGVHDGIFYVVVYTRRGTALRVISAWKAGRNDRERYTDYTR